MLSVAGTLLVRSVPIEDPDVIVSLASHEWERLPLTADLARRYPASTVLLTLPDVVNGFNCHDCGNRVRRLARAGVPSRRVQVLPLRIGGTYGEAAAVAEYLRAHRLRSVLVVTSPYHTRRSLATFRHAVEDLPVRVGVLPSVATSPSRPRRWWQSPYDRWYVRYEWEAMAYYAFRHGVWSF